MVRTRRQSAKEASPATFSHSLYSKQLSSSSSSAAEECEEKALPIKDKPHPEGRLNRIAGASVGRRLSDSEAEPTWRSPRKKLAQTERMMAFQRSLKRMKAGEKPISTDIGGESRSSGSPEAVLSSGRVQEQQERKYEQEYEQQQQQEVKDVHLKRSVCSAKPKVPLASASANTSLVGTGSGLAATQSVQHDDFTAIAAMPSPPRAIVQAERASWNRGRNLAQHMGAKEIKSHKSQKKQIQVSARKAPLKRALSTTGSQSDDGDRDSTGFTGRRAHKLARQIALLPEPFLDDESGPSRRVTMSRPAVGLAGEAAFVSLLDRSFKVDDGLTNQFSSDGEILSDQEDSISLSDDEQNRDRAATLASRHYLAAQSQPGAVPAFLPELPASSDDSAVVAIDDDVVFLGASPATSAARVARRKRKPSAALFHPTSRPRPERARQQTLFATWRSSQPALASPRHTSSWKSKALDRSELIAGPEIDLGSSSGSECDQPSLRRFFGIHGREVVDELEEGSDLAEFIVKDDDVDALQAYQYPSSSSRRLSRSNRQARILASEHASSVDSSIESDTLLADPVVKLLPKNEKPLDTDDEILEDLLNGADGEGHHSAKRGTRVGLRRRRTGSRLRRDNRQRSGSYSEDSSSASSSWNLLEKSDSDADSSEMPRASQLRPVPKPEGPLRLREAFGRYLQFIASCICDITFFNDMRSAFADVKRRRRQQQSDSSGDDSEAAKDRDAAEYFRAGEDRVSAAVWQRYELLMRSSAWNNSFQRDLERYGQFRSWNVDVPGHTDDCEACQRRNHPVAFEVALGPPRYRAKPVWDGEKAPPLRTREDSIIAQEEEGTEDSHSGGDSMDSSSEDRAEANEDTHCGRLARSSVRLYRLGRNCHERTHLFHSLYHYNLHVWQKVEQRVRSRQLEKLRAYLAQRQHERRSPIKLSSSDPTVLAANVDIVRELLEDKLFVSSAYRELSSLLDAADAFARKGMTRQ